MRALEGRVVALAFVALVTSGSCGTKSPCDAALCQGCCDPLGVCLVGDATVACGSAGKACSKCEAGNVCFEGTCLPTVVCTQVDQCTTVQCRCGDGATLPSRECRMGRCVEPVALCDSACVAGGHPKPGSGDGGVPGFSFCVDGTSSSCTGSQLTWSGGRCCVTVGYGQCTMGTAAACSGADLVWTGSTCCVRSSYGSCVDGVAAACLGDSMEWTGLQCCVKDSYVLCTEGSEPFCGGGGDFAWTGSKCCAISAFTQCTEGTQAACQSPNMRWTGQKCCVRNVSMCADGQPGACTGEWTGTKCCT